MPRERISMTPEEVAEFLGRQEWVLLATIEPDGSPWGDLVAASFAGGRLFFRVPAATRSLANIRRDRRVCCMNDQYPTYYEIKGAAVHGAAEPVPEGEVPADLIARPDPLTPGARPEGDFYTLPLGDVVSFDFSRIAGR